MTTKKRERALTTEEALQATASALSDIWTAYAGSLHAYSVGLAGVIGALEDIQSGKPVSDSMIARLEDTRKHLIELEHEVEKARRTTRRKLREWCGPSRKKTELTKEFLRSLKTMGIH